MWGIIYPKVVLSACRAIGVLSPRRRRWEARPPLFPVLLWAICGDSSCRCSDGDVDFSRPVRRRFMRGWQRAVRCCAAVMAAPRPGRFKQRRFPMERMRDVFVIDRAFDNSRTGAAAIVVVLGISLRLCVKRAY